MFTPNDCKQGYDYRCLSTDTKPTEGIEVNTVAWELDTNKFTYFTGEEWAEVGAEA